MKLPARTGCPKLLVNNARNTKPMHMSGERVVNASGPQKRPSCRITFLTPHARRERHESLHGLRASRRRGTHGAAFIGTGGRADWSVDRRRAASNPTRHSRLAAPDGEIDQLAAVAGPLNTLTTGCADGSHQSAHYQTRPETGLSRSGQLETACYVEILSMRITDDVEKSRTL